MLIPKELVPRKAIDKRYKLDLFNEKMCIKCDNKELRPNDLCRSCDGLTASYKLFRETANHWSVPQGDYLSLTKLLERKDIDYDVVDKRKQIPMRFPIKFTGKLFGANHVDDNGITRIDQKKLLRKWFEYEEGILKAKPRAGKTVMAGFATCRLKQRTIILADRKELIKQFYRMFMGDPIRKRPAMTNIPELQKKTGKEIIRVATKPKDLTNLEDVDILLVNYQKLVRDPKRMAALVEGNFSFLIVDEVHGSGAEGYLRVVSNCSVRHRMGLSATPRRKDNRHKLIHRIMGPVVAESGTASLIPEIRVRKSKAIPRQSYKMWTYAIGWLSSNKALQIELLQALFHDLRNGHDCILVLVDRRAHIDLLVKMVNQQAMKNRAKGEKWPKELALKFYDGVDRDKVLLEVDRGGPTILFGMRQMTKQGIDFELPSKIHIFIPMSASTDRETGAPLFEQLSNRICTPAKKPQPVIDIWFHQINMFTRCNIGLWWNEIWPNRVTASNPNGKYRVSQEECEKVKNMNMNIKSLAQSRNFDWAK
jgi:hypothetical protein